MSPAPQQRRPDSFSGVVTGAQSWLRLSLQSSAAARFWTVSDTRPAGEEYQGSRSARASHFHSTADVKPKTIR